ncbi:MAG: hypothetical protein ABI155_05990 [Paralcaligenes sp.]
MLFQACPLTSSGPGVARAACGKHPAWGEAQTRNMTRPLDGSKLFARTVRLLPPQAGRLPQRTQVRLARLNHHRLGVLWGV